MKCFLVVMKFLEMIEALEVVASCLRSRKMFPLNYSILLITWEALAIEINPSLRLVLLLIYVPPSSPVAYFDSLITWMSTFIGDCNINFG